MNSKYKNAELLHQFGLVVGAIENVIWNGVKFQLLVAEYIYVYIFELSSTRLVPRPPSSIISVSYSLNCSFINTRFQL